MKQQIIKVRGVCYAAFIFVVAAIGAIIAIHSYSPGQETTDPVAGEDTRGDGYCERLPGLEGGGSSEIRATAPEKATTSETWSPEDGDHGWVDLTDQTVEKQLAKFTPNCAIFWTADWCRYCKDMYPVVAKLQEEGYTVHVINYDKNKALAAHMGIKKLPTTIIWQVRKEVSRYLGVVSSLTLKKTLKKNKKKKIDYGIW